MEKTKAMKFIVMIVILFGVILGLNNYSFGKHFEVPEENKNEKYYSCKLGYSNLEDYDNIFCIERAQKLTNTETTYRYYDTINLTTDYENVAYIVKNYSGQYYRRRKRSYV